MRGEDGGVWDWIILKISDNYLMDALSKET